MKVIAYSLFGYNKEKPANCFTFDSYLRGLMINVRLARLLYPDWRVFVYVDQSTYLGLRTFFDSQTFMSVIVCSDAPLTKAMLWRMMPAFQSGVELFICRDTDSPLTFRERQAVFQWEQSPKQAHSITDSISHNIPMLGGMVGFKTLHFKERLKVSDWDEMVDKMGGYEVKGRDQDFLNQYVYPAYANTNDSIMMHYLLGRRNPFIDGYMTCNCRADDGTHHKEGCKLDIDVKDLSNDLKETNNFAGHIGAAGWYEPPMFKFFEQHLDKFRDIREAEQKDTTVKEMLSWKI